MKMTDLNISNPIEEALKVVVESIKDDDDVVRIILFGSYAYGKPNEESDLDIAVITNRPFMELTETYLNLRRKLRKKIKVSLDLLIFNEERLKDRVKAGFSFETEILEKGVVLYG